VNNRQNLKSPERVQTIHVVAILVTLALSLAGIEAGTRFAFARLSRIEGRIMTEHAAVLRFPRAPSGKRVLLVGDSLLLEDVDMNILGRAVPADVHLQRFAIEQTYYLDWLYGLRRLIAEGALPSTIVLCLNPNNFISDTTRGDYSAFYLFQAREIPAVAKRAHFNLTTESSLFFAHYSLFYAGRSGLRNFMLNKADHSYVVLLHRLLTRPSPPISNDEVLQISERRFVELQQLCVSHSVHFVYLMPPGFGFHESAMVEAASRSGSSILVPVHTDAWPIGKFFDGFHLNEDGARDFTEILSPAFNALLQSFEKQVR
jgi:hypothetical protein